MLMTVYPITGNRCLLKQVKHVNGILRCVKDIMSLAKRRHLKF